MFDTKNQNYMDGIKKQLNVFHLYNPQFTRIYYAQNTTNIYINCRVFIPKILIKKSILSSNDFFSNFTNSNRNIQCCHNHQLMLKQTVQIDSAAPTPKLNSC